MGKTLFAGEYSSRNIGDGIIKLAIAKLCADNGINAEFRDFFGQPMAESTATPDAGTSTTSTHASPTPRKNSLKKRLLEIAAVNYAIAVLFYFTRYRKIAASYQPQQYDQVVIGGGNLLMDNFWNFPLLILRIVQECERKSVPVKLFAVGAGKKYSWLCGKIVARILSSPAVKTVVCRDQHSYDLIRNAADDKYAHKVLCSYDCALYLDRAGVIGQSGELIGLGVIAPDVLKAVIPEHPMADKGFALKWWAALLESLAIQVGADKIQLISNGSVPDNEFAQEIWDKYEPKHPGMSLMTDVRTPMDLMHTIGSYRAMAAFRMHAAVSAMAMGVPVVGFEWDPKVLHLFSYCGKRDACVSLTEFRQRSTRDIAQSLLTQTPVNLSVIRASLARDFQHVVNNA